jgi:hypothetical protein
VVWAAGAAAGSVDDVVGAGVVWVGVVCGVDCALIAVAIANANIATSPALELLIPAAITFTS